MHDQSALQRNRWWPFQSDFSKVLVGGDDQHDGQVDLDVQLVLDNQVRCVALQPLVLHAVQTENNDAEQHHQAVMTKSKDEAARGMADYRGYPLAAPQRKQTQPVDDEGNHQQGGGGTGALVGVKAEVVLADAGLLPDRQFRERVHGPEESDRQRPGQGFGKAATRPTTLVSGAAQIRPCLPAIRPTRVSIVP